MVIYDEAGTVLDAWADPLIEKRTGIGPHNTIGKKITNFLPSPEGKKRLERIQRVIRTGRHETHEDPLEINGHTFWTEVSLSPLQDEQTSPVAVVVFIRDITARIQAKQALKESNARLQYIIDNTSDLITQMDTEGNFTFCNQAAEQITGYTTKELLNMSLWDLVAPEHVEQARYRIDNRRNSRPLEQPFVMNIISKNGQRVTLEISTTAVMLSEGTLGAIQSIARDITKRIQTEEALRESEEKYRALVENAGEAICTLTAEGIYTFVNSTGASRLGIKPEDIIGKSMYDFFPKEVAHSQIAAVQSVIFAGQGVVSDSQTVLDGNRIWYRTTIEPLRAVDGHIYAALVIARDISRMKWAEQELFESEAKTRALLDASTERAMLLDTKGNILAANETVAKSFNRSISDLVGLNIFSLILNEPSTRKNIFEQAVKDGRAYKHENWRDGRLLASHIYPILDLNGKVGSVAVFTRDITEQRRAEQMLYALNRKLMTAREQERRRLAAELHDSIGQEITAMFLNLKNFSPRARECLEKEQYAAFEKTVERCGELIDGIRNISHGLYPPTLESLGLCAALRQLAGEYSQQIDISIQCIECAEKARFTPDIEIALFRIAQEAITNIARHSKADTATVDLHYGYDEVTMTITDNGTGFDTEAAKGHGMGLNTMQVRAGAVGGELTITSEPGETQLKVRMPGRPLPDNTQQT